MQAEQLLSTLEKIYTLHRSLYDLSLEKTDFIKKGDTEALNDFIKKNKIIFRQSTHWRFSARSLRRHFFCKKESTRSPQAWHRSLNTLKKLNKKSSAKRRENFWT